MVDITPIEPGSADYTDLLNCRGPFAAEWINAWNALLPHERDFCTHPVWICAFLYSIEDISSRMFQSTPVKVFNVRREGKLVTCVPLMQVPVVSRIPPLYYAKSPKIVAGSSLAAPADMTGEIMRALFTTDLWDGRPPVSIIFDQVDNANALLTNKMRCVSSPQPGRAVLMLDGSYDHILSTMSRDTRKRLRRWNRVLTAQGAHMFAAHTKKTSLMDAFDRFIDLEATGWKHDSPYALKNSVFNRTFYRYLLDHQTALDDIAVFELWLDETLLASQLSVVIGDTLYSLKITYNEEYGRYSPSHLLAAKVIEEYMVPRGLREFNCLSESPGFHRTFRADIHATMKCVLFPDSPVGGATQLLYNAYHAFRSISVRQRGV